MPPPPRARLALTLFAAALVLLQAQPAIETVVRAVFEASGGPDAFLVPATTFEDFQIAFRRKLIREIAGRRDAELAATPTKDPP